jgi:aspartyl-tRNA(Asn)/glutamyl-tRNA(Gln) amidotransferase subunit C
MPEPLTEQQVLRVAALARLKLTPQEIRAFAPQLNQVLDYVAQLNEVDSENVEPMVHAIELSNVLRADQTAPSLPRDAALQNAPQSDGRYFLAPPILDVG